jgi:hypothetical protein
MCLSLNFLILRAMLLYLLMISILSLLLLIVVVHHIFTNMIVHDTTYDTFIVASLKLWGLLQDAHLLHDVLDTIIWKFTNDGKYFVSSAYKMKFEGLVSTSLNSLKSLGSSKV